MQIFNWVKKHILKKEERVIKIIENEQTLVMAVSPVEEIQFESDDIVTISQNNFIDTTDPLSIAKYKNNLRLLVDEVKEKKSVDKFKIIRDDDFFPTDWQWRVASQSTGIELSSFGLSYALKQIVASYNLGNYQNNPFSIPLDHDKLNEEMRKLGRYFAAIYMPVRFRSTKHFTINTPLSYTGEYNCVESDRNFTIIDNINNFLLSGYAYSADYRDAYLDVTHESLSISEEAIVLIAEDRYQTLLQDPKIASDLEKRHVIVYRGEEAVAINMILSQEGVLPARPGNRYMIYDDEIRTILENSMKMLCANNGIEYSKGHGNIDGKGGHFSDLYDGYNREFYEAQDDFIAFLINCFPENTNLINYRILRDSYYAENLIKAVIKQESNYVPTAVSHKGAVGLMQIMPQTGVGLGITDKEMLKDPYTNIMAGSRYLSQMLNRYDGRLDLSLSAYNAGPALVDRLQRIPNIEETQNYVKNIIGYIK